MARLWQAVLGICLIQVAWARIGFKKDTSIDKVEFPPRNIKTMEGVPMGHLRPIGYQRRPDGKVLEVDSVPSPQDFYNKFVKELKPAVFRKMVENVPAMKNWESDQYLKRMYGDLKVHVVVKKELFERQPPKAIPFKKFLKEYQYEDWYLSNTVPEEMMKELVLPSCLKCGMTKRLMEAEIWMSSGGTASLLHSHADHNLHCVLAGRKDFVVINPDHKDKVEWEPSDAHPGEGHSMLDMDMINMFKYPEFAQVNWHWSILRPGDCIYIPAGHMHQVRSWGRSFSSTMLWAPSEEVSFDDCKGVNLDEVTPLDKGPFLWTYTHGDRELANIKLNGRSLVYHLDVIMRTEKTLRFELFKDFYEEIFSELDDHKDINEIWGKLDPANKGEVTKEELKKIKKETLDEVAKYLNYAHTHRPKHDEL